MKDLLLNFVTYGLAVSLERLMSFLLLPLYADAFSVEEFGVIDLVQTFCSFVVIFAFLQLETALQRYYYEYEGEEKGQFIFSIFVVIMSASLILSIGIILLAPYVSSLLCGSVSYTQAFRIAGVLINFSALSTLTLIVLRFEKQNKLFTFVILFKSILLAGSVYWFVSVNEYGVNGFFISQLTAISVSAIVSLFLIRKVLVLSLSKDMVKLSLKYSLPQFPARVGSTINVYANRFFILGYLSTFSVGLFSMALKVGSIFQLVHQTFMMAWNQYMFQIIKRPDNKELFKGVFRILVPTICFISICLFLFSEELIVNYASPKFVESSKYVGGIMISIVLVIVKEIVDIGPKYKAKTYYLSVSFLAALSVNLVSLFFLVKFLGIAGVVYSMILTNSTLLVLSWKFSYRLYPIKFSYSVLVASLLPSLTLAIIMIYVHIPVLTRLIILVCLAIYYFLITYKSVSKYRKLKCHI